MMMKNKFMYIVSVSILFCLARIVVYAGSDNDGIIKFAFITDTHLADNTTAIEDLKTCLWDVNRQDSLDFVVFGGDVTDFGTDEEISLAKRMMDTIKFPYWVVQGNHDANWSESGCNTFLKVFGYEHFDFKSKGWRFIGCNSGPDMRMAPGLAPRETMEWLKSLQDEGKCIFINHYPMDSSVLNYFDVTRQLKRLNVRFEIGGHWHRNTILNYQGIPGVLCRSSLSAGNAPGYTIVRLSSDKITFSERRIYGSTAVEFEPWRVYEFNGPVVDTVKYDADGLPEDYPWIRYDVNRKYPQVKELWRQTFEANLVAGFAVKGGNAYFPLSSGVMKCISLKDGHTIWSKSFPGKIYSTPAISGNNLVFGCSDGNVYALKSSDGSVKWKYQAAKSVLASPLIMNGIVYIGASDNTFRAIDLKTGKAVWSYTGVEGHAISTPYGDSQRIVFGTWGRKLYSLDPKTGREQWVWTVKKGSRMYSPAHCVPVCASGRIYVAVPDRRVYAIDAATGKELFHVEGGRDAIGLSDDGTKVFSKVMFSRLYAFPSDVSVPSEGDNLASSAKLWDVRDTLGYDIAPSALTEKEGVLYVPTDKGNLAAFNSEDGSLLWIHKISLALINPVKVLKLHGKSCVLVSSMDGTVELLEN